MYKRQGTALGLHAAITGVGLLIAGVWAGLAWHGTGRLPLIISGCVVAVLTVALVAFGARLERTEPPEPIEALTD